MKQTQRSSLPLDTPKIQKLFAKIVHNGMYIFMFFIAFSGLLIGYFYWLGFKNGFFINLLISWHETSVSLVYWLIMLHLIGAFYHRFRNDGVWDSMVPFFNKH